MKLRTRREVFAETVAACAATVFLPLTISKAGATATHRVEIRQFKFVPGQLSVKQGDTIIWTNQDIVPHTATADDKSWDTGKLKKGQSESIVVLDSTGNSYFCRFHRHMKANLLVE